MSPRKDSFGSRRDFDPDQDEFYGIRDDGDERWLTYRKLILSRLQDLKEAYESVRTAIEDLRRAVDQRSNDQTQINSDLKNAITSLLNKLDVDVRQLKDSDSTISEKIDGHLKSTDAVDVLRQSKNFTVRTIIITAILGLFSAIVIEFVKAKLQ